MSGIIVPIGGGDIRTRGTAAIDRELIRLSGKRRPALLFIPTASSDSERYCRHVEEYFGRFLRCHTEVLRLLSERPSHAAVHAAILSADIIYVGGGNTLLMMRTWRRLGVDRLLRLAYARGTVLAGMSAGSICWFDAGHSDSMSFYDPHDWEYIAVRGLGLLRGLHCPHYDSRTRGVPRRASFRAMIGQRGGWGIAIENNCGIEFVGDQFRVISSKKGAHAYRLRRRDGQVVAHRIPEQRRFLPTATLYHRPS